MTKNGGSGHGPHKECAVVHSYRTESKTVLFESPNCSMALRRNQPLASELYATVLPLGQRKGLLPKGKHQDPSQERRTG